ncbi:E3 ubiquitin-protein ligase RNF31 isoform X2 [Nematostella vectensis]|uniref:E3 ubiquitin-protein ligase RNF31 isoform X2 n=1 Tax=Nematostella vectensis TaxID=45351 RepID=UPI0020775D4A|nr:E3 ubiquitin-protein ligase RNF31 isoform X2 [Nematostella vectensis]
MPETEPQRANLHQQLVTSTQSSTTTATPYRLGSAATTTYATIPRKVIPSIYQGYTFPRDPDPGGTKPKPKVLYSSMTMPSHYQSYTAEYGPASIPLLSDIPGEPGGWKIPEGSVVIPPTPSIGWIFSGLHRRELAFVAITTPAVNLDENLMILQGLRTDYEQEYFMPTDQTMEGRVQKCRQIIDLYVPINEKYKQLDVENLLEKNNVKEKLIYTIQALAILEKYATNLLKPMKPINWRTVKFTSSLVRTYLENIEGSTDILRQMGYTANVQDGLSFPDNIIEPNVEKVRELAADLYLARVEIGDLVKGKHPYFGLRELDDKAANAIISPQGEAKGDGVRVDGDTNPFDRVDDQSGEDVSDGPKATQIQREHESPDSGSDYEDALDNIPPGSPRPSSAQEAKPDKAAAPSSPCFICGEDKVELTCKDCAEDFCRSCDGVFHRNPARTSHTRMKLGGGASKGEATRKPDGPPAPEDRFKGKRPIPTPRKRSVKEPPNKPSPQSTANALIETRSLSNILAPNRAVFFPPSYQTSSLNDEEEHIYVSPRAFLDSENPPPLPPKTTKSKPVRRQLSCPNCHCMNMENSKACKVCHQPLTERDTFFPKANDAKEKQPGVPLSSYYPFSGPVTYGLPVPLSNSQTIPHPAWQASATTSKQEVMAGNSMAAVAGNSMAAVAGNSMAAETGNVMAAVAANALSAVGCIPFPQNIMTTLPTQTGHMSASSEIPGIKTTQHTSVPKTVKEQWQCEYCTFLNSLTVKICDMCFKTRTANAKVVKPEQDPGPLPVYQERSVALTTKQPTLMSQQPKMYQPPLIMQQPKMSQPPLTQQPLMSQVQATATQSPVVTPSTATMTPTPNMGPPKGYDSYFLRLQHQEEEYLAGEREKAKPSSESSHGSTAQSAAGLQDFKIHDAVRSSSGPQGLVYPQQPIRTAAHQSMPSQNLPTGELDHASPPPAYSQVIQHRDMYPAVFSPTLPASRSTTVTQQLTPQTTYTQRTAQGLPSYPTLPPPPPPPPQTTPFGYSSASHETQNPIRTDLWREREEMLIEGRRYVDLLKTAEINNFLPEELNIAITLSEGMEMGPIEWLKTKWFDLIHTVMLRVTEKSKCADIGNISPEEARQALIEHTGDVEPAVEYCVTQRENKLTKVMDSGIYVRTDCIKELDKSNGDVDRAIRSLELLTLAPFRQRILERCRPVEGEGEAAPCPPSRQVSETDEEKMFCETVSDRDQDIERRVRVMLAQKSMLSWGRALTAIKLIDENFAVEDSIIAAQDNGDLERSKKFLQRECIVCMDLKPENRMITMLNCQCRFCSDCVSQYVKQIIQEQNIMHLVCPACSEPKNLEDDTVATNYFNLLDILIRPLVDNPTHDLFQRKLRDRTLMKEPNFRWCSHCSSGFINERPGILKMPCPHCHKYTCFQCKKQWEDQHEGISCEQFAAWKEANDPEAQATGLAAHLKQNGIECPNCKFRYDLAKGGCMHFKCGQCSHEYCSGCYGPFRHGAHCPVSPHCAMRGLHAHHPRDCLFYLRDRDPEELQQLLAENNVAFDTVPPQRTLRGQGEANAAFEPDEEEGAAAAPGHCRVMEQAEAGTEDKECGRPTPDGYAGLCRMHYIEYLVERVNANLIDPVSIMTSDQLKLALEREDQAVPQKKETENNKNFRARLVQLVKTQIPLPRKPPRRRVLDIEEEPLRIAANEPQPAADPLPRDRPRGFVFEDDIDDDHNPVFERQDLGPVFHFDDDEYDAYDYDDGDGDYYDDLT